MTKDLMEENSDIDILIVDDTLASLKLMADLLISEGYSVRPTNNPQLALQSALAKIPTLILLDVRMPGMDGFELCQRLKQVDSTASVPVIFVTSLDDKYEKVKGFEVGGVDYITKPIQPEEVLVRVSTQVALARTAQDLERKVYERTRDLIASENKYRRLVESLESEYIFYSLNTEGEMTYVSPSLVNVLGYQPADFIKHYHDYYTDHPSNREAAVFTKAALQGKKVPAYELQIYHSDGTIRWLEITETPVSDFKSKLISVEGIAHDITEQLASYSALEKLAYQNSLILNSTAEGIFGVDSQKKFTFVNQAAAKMLGYDEEEIIGMASNKTLQQHLPDDSTSTAKNCPIDATLSSGSNQTGEEYFIRKDGSIFPVIFLTSPIIEEEKITGVVVSFSDISEKKKAEAKIDHLVHYDVLTNLPNRQSIMERIKQALILGRRYQHHSALLLINIDRFKNINDARGQIFGDELLKAVASRLSDLLGEVDTLARLESDEYAILLPELAQELEQSSREARIVAEKVLRSMQLPIVIKDEEISITVSLGITSFPEKSDINAEQVLRRANTALHRVKEKGGNLSAFFETDMTESVETRFNIERELRQAVANNELRLYLQPQVDSTEKLVGFESLVRWQHPTRGLVPPNVFIPIAEESDLIVEIGNWVLTEALKLLAWGDVVGHPLHLSVNMSTRQFKKADFYSGLVRQISATGADPNHLVLEVTESLLIENINEMTARMIECSALGIKFSIDDFGTGYSSLSYLKRLPVHELKIDKSFIQEVTLNESDAGLVETILAVAKHMHLKVVAEGVETKEQAAFLNRHPNVIQQGYLFGKPQPASDVLKHWFGVGL